MSRMKTVSVEADEAYLNNLRLVAAISDIEIGRIVRESLDARFGELLTLSRAEVVAHMQNSIPQLDVSAIAK